MRKKRVFSEKETDLDLCISPADEHQSFSSSLFLMPAFSFHKAKSEKHFSLLIKPNLLLFPHPNLTDKNTSVS